MQVTRVFVVSDLHLGGSEPPMMSHAQDLANFITALPMQLRKDEKLELVIAGDFIDFLAIELDGKYDAWTDSITRAVEKLKLAMRGRDAAVYDALGSLVRSGHALTVLVGNHDLEMAIPSVQQAFCENLGATRHQVLFVDDGQAWRIGNALIEHGNRYDGANLNDWQGLRAIVSHWSRGEVPPAPLEVSAGSRIVEHVVNPLKKRYPFIDIFQPQGELLGYLLLAMEPELKCDFKSLRYLTVGGMTRLVARQVGPPRAERQVAARPNGDALVGRPLDTKKLDNLLGVEPFTASEKQVGAREWFDLFLTSPGDNLAKYLESGEKIPDDRLCQLQKVIAEMIENDDTLNPSGNTEQYGRNAERLCKACGAQVVVMGHTHTARYAGDAEKGLYINTGTWVDSIRVPRGALEQNRNGADQLEAWLRDLYHDRGVRTFQPHWADLRIETDGSVSQAHLCPC
jgi:UDP-2,3-diacylglucosamine pyrophosphatase LpxH